MRRGYFDPQYTDLSSVEQTMRNNTFCAVKNICIEHFLTNECDLSCVLRLIDIAIDLLLHVSLGVQFCILGQSIVLISCIEGCLRFENYNSLNMDMGF